MSIFKKETKEIKKSDPTPAPTKETPTPEEKWIWVEGYKGTDKDMRCRDYQYEIGKQFNMPEEESVAECHNGFHLCLKLEDVFGYYPIQNGHRFFKVQALVRESDAKKYRKYEETCLGGFIHDKIVAKSIIFISELTTDEIFKAAEISDLPDNYRLLALECGVCRARKAYHRDALIEDGYSKPFVEYLVAKNKFEIAHALGSQKDLSMDMKVFTIFS
jgi:hypothetical protein